MGYYRKKPYLLSYHRSNNIISNRISEYYQIFYYTDHSVTGDL